MIENQIKKELGEKYDYYLKFESYRGIKDTVYSIDQSGELVVIISVITNSVVENESESNLEVSNIENTPITIILKVKDLM